MLSLILCFHRINLKEYLIDPHFCFTDDQTVDFPSLVLFKILSAIPSTASFSLQLFIESWNQAGKAPRIHPGFSDVAALAEGVVANLQLKKYAARPPALTEFLGSFACGTCGKDNVRVKSWAMQVQAMIPLLQLPDGGHPVDVTELLTAYVDEHFETYCSDLNCYQRIFDGKLEVRQGVFTILAVNRFDVTNPNNKKMNRLEFTGRNALLGELVSLICHRGDVNRGHFISYHKVAEQWFLNDDSRPCIPSNNPLDGSIPDETVEILFFKNNV